MMEDCLSERAQVIGQLAAIHADTGNEQVASLLYSTMAQLHNSIVYAVSAYKPKAALVAFPGGLEADNDN